MKKIKLLMPILVTTALISAATTLIGCSCKAEEKSKEVTILLNKDSLSLGVGKTYQLIATVTPPETAVTWSSADTSIATVTNDGTVQGIKAGGPVTITATAGNKTAICNVTVTTEKVLEKIEVTWTGLSNTTYVGDKITKDNLTVKAKWEGVTEPETIEIKTEQTDGYEIDKDGDSVTWDFAHDTGYTFTNDDKGKDVKFSIKFHDKTVFKTFNVLELKKYFTLTTTEKTTLTWTKGTIGSGERTLSYCLNDPAVESNWAELGDGEVIKFGSDSGNDSTLYLKGTLTKPTIASGEINVGNIKINPADGSQAGVTISGNLMNLIQVDSKPATSLEGYNCAFCQLFDGSTGIKNVDANILPANVLAKGCYQNMFKNCTSLTNAPELPATTLGTDDSGFDNCYQGMFYGCTSLKTAPELPAGKDGEGMLVAQHCYENMFNGCTSLESPPELPAKAIIANCYDSMFCGCTSLTQAPELPATEHWYLDESRKWAKGSGLAEKCYRNMFYGCTALKTLLENLLPADELAGGCYQKMFCGCENLKIEEGDVTSVSNKIFTCPDTSSLTNAVTDMFTSTGGTFKGTPSKEKTYSWTN